MTRHALSAEQKAQARALWAEGRKLGEIAAAVGCGVYALSPWLYAGEVDRTLEQVARARVLAFLQNTWVHNPRAGRRLLDGCPDPSARRALHTEWLFAGCLTGRRLSEAFGDWVELIEWSNASPELGDASCSSFPADPEHIRAEIEDVRPDVVLLFGRVAERGVRPLWGGPTIVGPHPTARHPIRPREELQRMREELDAFAREHSRGNGGARG